MSDRRPFDGTPLTDPEERQVIFATLDSFCSYKHFPPCLLPVRYLSPEHNSAVLSSLVAQLGVFRIYIPMRLRDQLPLSQYRRDSHYNCTHRRRQNLYALPKEQWRILAAPPFTLLDSLNAVDDAIDCNADIADAILDLGLHAFGLPAEPEKGSAYDWRGSAKPNDVVKAHSTIRQFYRDWSHEGYSAEVEPLLNTILDDLARMKAEGSSTPTLLMPGAGLGRLLFSMSLRGYSVEGNEISYHQLLASNFILNATKKACQYKLYPFITTFTNHKTRANQLREVLIPDIHPATEVAQQRRQSQVEQHNLGEMNMTAGDFLTSYGGLDSQARFDAVVTVYFIDTAPNLIRYIETVHNCLKEDGLWVNMGPLLWHFDDRRIGDEKINGKVLSQSPAIQGFMQDQGSVTDTGINEPGSFELTDEEVLLLLGQMGFNVLKHEYLSTNCGGYIQDPESMIQNRYQCSHWVAQKSST